MGSSLGKPPVIWLTPPPAGIVAHNPPYQAYLGLVWVVCCGGCTPFGWRYLFCLGIPIVYWYIRLWVSDVSLIVGVLCLTCVSHCLPHGGGAMPTNLSNAFPLSRGIPLSTQPTTPPTSPNPPELLFPLCLHISAIDDLVRCPLLFAFRFGALPRPPRGWLVHRSAPHKWGESL